MQLLNHTRTELLADDRLSSPSLSQPPACCSWCLDEHYHTPPIPPLRPQHTCGWRTSRTPGSCGLLATQAAAGHLLEDEVLGGRIRAAAHAWRPGRRGWGGSMQDLLSR